MRLVKSNTQLLQYVLSLFVDDADPWPAWIVLGYIYIYICVCVCITGFESTKDLNIKWRIYLKTFSVEEHGPAYLTWSKSWLQKACDATRQGISAHSMNLVISEYSDLFTSCAFYKHWLTLIRSWISNYIHYEVWAEITYPFLNSNGATVDV